MKEIRSGFGKKYTCKFDWPENVGCQSGGDGIVFTKGTLSAALTDDKKVVETLAAALDLTKPEGSYRTAFFEAFPPDTFIRGEGQTIEEAEEKAWNRYQRELLCSHEVYERRNYKNGVGFCVKCGHFKSGAFEPSEKCIKCGTATYYAQDINGVWYCEKCEIPEELMTETSKYLKKVRAKYEINT